MRVYISTKKIILMWLGVFVFFAALVFLVFFKLFTGTWGISQYVIISVYCLVMVAILIIAMKTQYYEINKKDITESKMGKKYIYYYSDILYVDDEEAKKGKTLCFVTNKGHIRYMSMDKEGKIYLAMKNRCKNLISREDLEKKFPGIKL